MAAANLVRSAFGGLLRKSTSYRTPVACRLSTVALQQKFRAANALIKAQKAHQLQNEVRFLSINTMWFLENLLRLISFRWYFTAFSLQDSRTILALILKLNILLL